ncbi:MAG: 30S ribosomal protein S1 [Planctomycetes bacterium]|jgi:small subunit ribosomal protein S1|nr:30S ribosomal protein S1 [Planctomycetota bacterium]
MVDYNLIRSLGVSEDQINDELSQVLGDGFNLDSLVRTGEVAAAPQAGKILKGRIVGIVGDEAVVEVGLKSEGTVDLHEWDNPAQIKVGDVVEVLLEEMESDGGLVVLSKRKADRIRGWERILEVNKEGDTVTGEVTRKIKGGLLVDIGVPAFLPASQVDVRRPSDIGEFIGQRIDAKILKIDQERRNIVVSRRKLIEERRAEAKHDLLNEIIEGQSRKGIVKNLADFGAFVDLGGLDGLLHITDMSWGRIGHPSEMLSIGQEIEVVVLSVDRDKEKISLGLKQKSENPWDQVEAKFPASTRLKGKVVNIMSYGAFVQLEEGLEGLVHISEMSWTRRINHPSEVVNVGDEVEVIVLEVDRDKQEISLGMKQAETNPWTLVKEKYPPGTVITGTVRNMTNYGAFVEIEEGIDGLLHVSDLSWTRKVGHPSEVLKKGQELQCVVLAVDEEKMRVALGLKQLTEDPWLRQIPDHYLPGQIVCGKVTKITNFGVFVELEDELEGLLHVSELADHKVENPKDVVKVGDEIEVKILRVDSDDRKIGLSLKRAQWAAEDTTSTSDSPQKRRGGLDGETGLLGSEYDNIIQTVRQQEPQRPKRNESKEVSSDEAEDIAMNALDEEK